MPNPATGTAARSNNTRNGSGPSRCRAWVIAEVEGTCQESDHDPIDRNDRNDPTSFRITSS